MHDVASICQLQQECVSRWHQQDIDNPHSGFDHLVCQQHAFNFRLWHQEDIARDPHVTDAEIATVKRAIDSLNQSRNDHIEKLDDAITAELKAAGVTVAPDAKLNTETAGSAIDRLSIMSLRLYHYQEQTERDDVDDEHRAKVIERIELCVRQLRDLSNSLQELIDDLFAGRKRHVTYRQMKMYNDASLNPRLYSQ